MAKVLSIFATVLSVLCLSACGQDKPNKVAVGASPGAPPAATGKAALTCSPTVVTPPAGTSDTSVTANAAAKKTAVQPLPPCTPAPTGLTLGAITDTSIVFNWISGGGTTAGYLVVVTPGTTAPADCSPDNQGKDIGNVLTYKAPLLSAGTAYILSVCSVGPNGLPSLPVSIPATTTGTATAAAPAAGDDNDTHETAGATGTPVVNKVDQSKVTVEPAPATKIIDVRLSQNNAADTLAQQLDAETDAAKKAANLKLATAVSAIEYKFAVGQDTTVTGTSARNVTVSVQLTGSKNVSKAINLAGTMLAKQRHADLVDIGAPASNGSKVAGSLICLDQDVTKCLVAVLTLTHTSSKGVVSTMDAVLRKLDNPTLAWAPDHTADNKPANPTANFTALYNALNVFTLPGASQNLTETLVFETVEVVHGKTFARVTFAQPNHQVLSLSGSFSEIQMSLAGSENESVDTAVLTSVTPDPLPLANWMSLNKLVPTDIKNDLAGSLLGVSLYTPADVDQYQMMVTAKPSDSSQARQNMFLNFSLPQVTLQTDNPAPAAQ